MIPDAHRENRSLRPSTRAWLVSSLVAAILSLVASAVPIITILVRNDARGLVPYWCGSAAAAPMLSVAALSIASWVVMRVRKDGGEGGSQSGRLGALGWTVMALALLGLLATLPLYLSASRVFPS